MYRIILLAILCVLVSGCISDETEPSPSLPFTLNASGGNGSSDGAGGFGGSIVLSVIGGESIKIQKEGSVEVSYPEISVDTGLGANPFVVASDSVIRAVTDTEPPVNAAYTMKDDPSCLVYIANGNSILADEHAVTGIDVRHGATLSIQFNQKGSVNENYDTACISLTNGLMNNGVVKPVDIDSLNTGNIQIKSGSLFGIGSIISAGEQDGQHGGDIYVQVDTSIVTYGLFSSAGSGGVSRSAGHGGSISISAGEHVQVFNSIDSSGGVSTDHHGGHGGDILLENAVGDLVLAGAVISSGGDGFSGGMGGNIQFRILYSGQLIQDGVVDAAGGSGIKSYAGTGGDIETKLHSGSITWKADTRTSGGDVYAAGFSPGRGGNIEYNVYTENKDDLAVVGDVTFSGNYSLTGGNTSNEGTAQGAVGGEFNLELESGSRSDQKVRFVGYEAFTLNGGAGNAGREAGYINVIAEEGWNEEMESWVVPSVSSDVDMILQGGDGSAEGGGGGEIFFIGDSISLQGTLDIRGGDADSALSGSLGGDAGMAMFEGMTDNLVIDFDTVSILLDGGVGETSGEVGTVGVDYECVMGNCDAYY